MASPRIFGVLVGHLSSCVKWCTAILDFVLTLCLHGGFAYENFWTCISDVVHVTLSSNRSRGGVGGVVKGSQRSLPPAGAWAG